MTYRAKEEMIVITRRELRTMLRQVFREVLRDDVARFTITVPEEYWKIEKIRNYGEG